MREDRPPAHRARRPRSVTQCLDSAEHAGSLDGAARVGEAALDGRVVRIGVFADGRARFKATTCASLIAYAEVACEALEAGVAAVELDASALQDRVTGVHPGHHERATLVAAAVRAAFPQEKP
jgi:hypothetical protein